MRKQQHIRDLEARVAILSGDRDERQEVMSLLIRNLMNENAQLRKMVKNLAGFIGEGLATCLPRLGLTQESMDAFVNRAETEAAHEAYEALKAAKKQEEQGGGTAAASLNSNNAKKGSYEQLFGPLGNTDTPNEGPSGGSKRKASYIGDEDDDEGYEDGDGDEDTLDRDDERDSNAARASSATHRDPVSATTAVGASTIAMSRSPSVSYGPNAAGPSSRRGPTNLSSSMRTAPVSNIHGVPLHTLDRLDSPTIAGDGVGDFSFSPYYNPPSSSAPGDGSTPGALNRGISNNGEGIPLQYLSSTLHEMRDPLASPETALNGNQLPSYAYQEQQQQRGMNLPMPPQLPQYVSQPSASLTTTNGSAPGQPEQSEAARETFDREFERVISGTMGRKQESFQLISYHLNK
jgi:hypothetical protein